MTLEVEAKIKSIEEIGALLRQRGSKKVVLCHGEFDLLHFGHTRYFKAARKFGDILIVTLTPDRFIAKGPGRPVFNESQRAESIANLQFVDYVGINQWPTAMETLDIIRPDIYVKGSEYLNKVDVTGRLDAERNKIEALGGRMEFTHEVIYSSSKLLNNHFSVFSSEAQPFLKQLASQCKSDEVLASLVGLQGKRILLVGDYGLEEVNQLAPGQPSQVQGQHLQPQGALLGAAALTHQGASLTLFTLPGSTQDIQSQLPVGTQFLQLSEGQLPCPSSRSYYDPAGYCRFNASEPGQMPQEADLLHRLNLALPQVDLVLAWDQGKGYFTPAVKQLLGEQAPALCLLLGENADLQGWHNLDLLAAPQKLQKTLSWELASAPFWRKGQRLLLAETGGGLLWIGPQGKLELPALLPPDATAPQVDSTSVAFAWAAVATSLGLAEGQTLLLAAATSTLARRGAKAPYRFDKIDFDKFIITLLNF